MIFLLFTIPAYSFYTKGSDIQIRAKKLFLNYERNTAEYSGNVVVSQGETRIKCNRSKIYYKRNNSNSTVSKGINKMLLEKIEFYEDVSIKNNVNSAYSDYGVFNANTGLVILEKNVRLKDKRSDITGNKLIYNTKTETMKLVDDSPRKRVQAIIKG